MKTSNKILLSLIFIAIGLFGYVYFSFANYDASNLTYDSKFLDVSARFTQSIDNLYWKTDGTKLYVGGTLSGTTRNISQYSCSVAWDISTCTYDSIQITPRATYANGGLWFSSDGTKLFTNTSNSGGTIYRWTCSTAWLLSTCNNTGEQSYNFGNFFNWWISSDGLYLITANSTTTFQVYNFGTAWDLTTLSIDTGNTANGNPSLRKVNVSGDNDSIIATREGTTTIESYDLLSLDLEFSGGINNNKSYNYSAVINNSATGFYCVGNDVDKCWLMTNNSTEIIYQFTANDGFSPEPCTGTGCTTTRIEWVYPFEGESTASRTIDFELTYYFNSTTHDSSIYTQILILACSLINVSPFNQNLNECERLYFEPEILNYDTTVTEGATFTLNTDGAYLLIAEFWNGIATPSYCSWWEIFCDEEQVEVLVPNAININVATTSIGWDSIIDAVGTNKTATSILCGDSDAEWYDIADLTAGYFCRVLVFLFYPDATLGGQNTQLNALWNNLSDKLPFALYFAPYSKFYEMSNETASSSFGAFEMPIMGLATPSFDFKDFKDNHGDFLDALTTPINYFLWFWFALYIFRDLTGAGKSKE